MYQLNLERQSGLIPEELVEDLTVSIIGCGAIGSHMAEILSKIGIRNMRVWDFDRVESHNLPNQGFALPDLGKFKVEAIKEKLQRDVGLEIKTFTEPVDETTEYETTLVIAAVDSMKARKAIWEGVQRSTDVELFIDARMGAMFGKVLIIRPNEEEDKKFYEENLFTDEEGFQAPCTEKATIFCAIGLAAWMTAIVAAFITNEELPPYLDADYVRMEAGRP